MKKHIIETVVTVLDYEELSKDDRKLVDISKQSCEKAYAPYSTFYVGAAVLLENGEVVTGNNQENAAYPSGLCAERVTMFYANAQYPDIKPLALAISAKTNGSFLENPITPCGACRQVLLETEQRYGSPIRVLLIGKNKVYLLNDVRSLLPLTFEKSALNL